MQSTMKPAVRLDSLDYLRGLAALGIMLYHVASWTFGDQPADTFSGRIGTYGVSIFYVLSGLTLQHVYFSQMTDMRSVRQFFVRRVFRIFPLLWLVTIIAIVLSRTAPDPFDLFLNLTGLFGFVSWDTYFSAGVWSIGNELVFYALFPIIVLAARSRAGLWVVGAVLGGLYLYFAFIGIDPSESMTDEWSTYINPLNQAFLFYCGFLIGHLLHSVRLSKVVVHGSLWGGIALFILWPTSAERIDLVTGWNRLVFTVLCVLICAAIYKIQPSLPRPVHVPLVTLGHASYSVYLLHPIVYNVLNKSELLGNRSTALATIVLTLVVAYASYRWFEMPINRLARKLPSREKNQITA
ncbi:acyltransferase family protein [Leucobacter sp. NPDC058333]|uniref:acyltransferase family protein n=1 Tax=Leucobacter sp. NPDC058333 TaxID=3346450 RepID=UPI003653306C